MENKVMTEEQEIPTVPLTSDQLPETDVKQLYFHELVRRELDRRMNLPPNVYNLAPLQGYLMLVGLEDNLASVVSKRQDILEQLSCYDITVRGDALFNKTVPYTADMGNLLVSFHKIISEKDENETHIHVDNTPAAWGVIAKEDVFSGVGSLTKKITVLKHVIFNPTATEVTVSDLATAVHMFNAWQDQDHIIRKIHFVYSARPEVKYDTQYQVTDSKRYILHLPAKTPELAALCYGENTDHLHISELHPVLIRRAVNLGSCLAATISLLTDPITTEVDTTEPSLKTHYEFLTRDYAFYILRHEVDSGYLVTRTWLQNNVDGTEQVFSELRVVLSNDIVPGDIPVAKILHAVIAEVYQSLSATYPSSTRINLVLTDVIYTTRTKQPNIAAITIVQVTTIPQLATNLVMRGYKVGLTTIQQTTELNWLYSRIHTDEIDD